MTHIPDPADRTPAAAQPDAASMVEVLSQSMDQHKAAMKAARDMIALYAIRALLDGANVLQIAHQCGFGRPNEPNTDAPGPGDIEDFLTSVGPPAFMASQVQVLGMGGAFGRRQSRV